MTFLKFLFYAFLFYLAFKFIFNLVIPAVRTTRKIKRGFREMQEKMQQQAQQYEQQQQAGRQKVESTSPQNKPGDYIEFEEIK